jgi:hypothetical protein
MTFHSLELPDDLLKQLDELNTKMENMTNWKDEMMNKVLIVLCSFQSIKNINSNRIIFKQSLTMVNFKQTFKIYSIL